MTITAPLAYLSVERHIGLINVLGQRRSLTELPYDMLLRGRWDIGPRPPGTYSWPTWSPTGRHIAAFGLPPAPGLPSRVVALDIDGVHQIEVLQLHHRNPIYPFWGPDGEQLALLTQDGDALHLSATHLELGGFETPLATGSPLFFTWAGRDQVAAFVGDSKHKGGSKLALLGTDGTAPIVFLPDHPASFCAPVWLQDRVFYVAHGRAGLSLVSAQAGDTRSRHIEAVDGLVAMVGSPDGTTLARAIAPGGDGTPYRELALLDVVSGELQPLTTEPCLAFFWLPDGSGLMCVRVDTQRNLLEWVRVSLDGSEDLVAELYPTRDLGFYLRFFEQYCQSHAIIDPASQTLILAGSLAGYSEPHSSPHLWAVPVSGVGRARDLGEGLFGVFGPSPKLLTDRR